MLQFTYGRYFGDENYVKRTKELDHSKERIEHCIATSNRTSVGALRHGCYHKKTNTCSMEKRTRSRFIDGAVEDL